MFNYIAGGLVLLLYSPLILIALCGDSFRGRFMRVHARSLLDYIVEIGIALTYFSVFISAVLTPFTDSLFLFCFGILLYWFGFAVAGIGYLRFYQTPSATFCSRFPYSVVRHPTYLFTFIAMIGVGFMIFDFCVFGAVALGLFLTHFVTNKEEFFCRKKYGKSYERYVRETLRGV